MEAKTQDAGSGRDRPGAVTACLLAAVLVLLGLVALAGGRDGSTTAGPLPESFVDYVFTAEITLAVVAVLALLILSLAYVRVKMPHRSGGQARMLAGLLIMILLVSGALLVGRSGRDFLGDFVTDASTEGGQSSSETEPGADAGEGPVDFRWEVPAALVVLALAASVWARRRQTSAPTSRAPKPVVAEVVAHAIDSSLDDLRAESDPRRAVIAAYARMEQVLEEHGVPRLPSEAPLEYLERVLGSVEVGSAAVRDLSDLFESAKFSNRIVDDAMRNDAVEALELIRDDLRVAL